MQAAGDDDALIALARTIAGGDGPSALRVLAASPALARTSLTKGASRQASTPYFLAEIHRTLYAGDTALHVAAAAYEEGLARRLVAMGADVRARNRRGAEPLHAAAAGVPGSRSWNPGAQAATVGFLIEAGADPNAADGNGATPLHVAVRTRCAAAVDTLLARGADPRCTNKGGSTPLRLAGLDTGRGGAGSPQARAQQRQIIRRLEHAVSSGR